MELSKAEAISLILEIYTVTNGVWVDVEYNNPLLTQFISAGLTCLDVNDERKLVPNEQGTQLLFSHFEEISFDFIDFMQKRGLECPANEVTNWFVAKYMLPDRTMGEDISFMVAQKLPQFGYNSYTPHPSRKNDKFILQKA